MSLISLKDWIYLAAIIVLITAFGAYTAHERSLGAQHELAVVEKAGTKAKAEAQKVIDSLNSQYAAKVSAIEAQHADSLKSAAAQHDADVSRLRDYEARHRSPNPVLGSPTASAATPDAGSDGISSVGIVALNLAAALRADDAELTACWRERDLLTGK